LETADTKLVEDLESMMDTIFDVAEKQIERELYKRGLMTCNAYLERIDDMRATGNYLVQDYIKELDAKYGDQKND
jgi:vacuolar-type H+-ATPase subunit E/Vma4